MANAMDILFDDGACVEFLGHIVAGSANQLNPPLVGLVVGLSPGKRGQKAVVNIDHSPRIARAQLRGQYLHIARQHHAVGAGTVDFGLNLGKRCLLIVGVDRYMVIRNTVPLRQLTHIIMVGDNPDNVAIQFPRLPAVK